MFLWILTTGLWTPFMIYDFTILVPQTEIVDVCGPGIECLILIYLTSWAVGRQNPFRIIDPENECGICSREVYCNDKALLCEHCGKWIHISCDGVTKKQYNDYLLDDEDKKYECKKCRRCNVCNKVIPFISRCSVSVREMSVTAACPWQRPW